MQVLFIIVIYLCFFGLGIPDSVIGASWPAISSSFSIPLYYAGIVSMIITFCTIVSSLLSNRLINRFGTYTVSLVSILATTISLAGFYFSTNFFMLCFFALPLGLGAGAVDAALNNFVSNNYEAKYMIWLHCFWGIGATFTPLVVSASIEYYSWNTAYLFLALVQLFICISLALSFPLWRKYSVDNSTEANAIQPSISTILSTKNIKVVLFCFFCYTATEITAGLWTATYLHINKNIDIATSASISSLLYAGITLGCFINGFVSMKISTKNIIRLGIILCILGIIGLYFSTDNKSLSMFIFTVGFGLSPIYPSMLHMTSDRFGELSQSIMGIQLAVAYIGSTIMPPFLGILTIYLGTSIFPVFILITTLAMLICTEIANSNQQNFGNSPSPKQ